MRISFNNPILWMFGKTTRLHVRKHERFFKNKLCIFITRRRTITSTPSRSAPWWAAGAGGIWASLP
jgi:hypothetical protein